MTDSQFPAFLPKADPATWLGVMGGGQLGRMFAQAAQAMGYKVAVLEPSADCPAGQVAERLVVAGYEDAAGLDALAAQCAAVTTEFENVPAASLSRLAQKVFVAPDAHGVSVAQDRIAEKSFFVACASKSGVMPAPHKVIAVDADIDAIGDELLPGILKTVRMGYDGKGQVRVHTRADVRTAFEAMGQVACLLEKMLPLAYEVSVLTARGADGASSVYPIAENVHRDGILFTTTVPGPNVTEACARQAQDAARAIVAELGYVGVLCIEFFVLTDGSLVVNEMAPRPHNSGHYTIDACWRQSPSRCGRWRACRWAIAASIRRRSCSTSWATSGSRVVATPRASRPGTRSCRCRAPTCTCTARATRAAAARWVT
jgi:5-(carboxyamino)imidazole ribonucleotide synthase